MRRIATSEARRDFSETVNRVAYGGERVIVGRRGKELAAVVSLDDLHLLERLEEEAEDRLDVEEARRVLADKSDEAVDWKTAKQELKGAVQSSGKAQRAARPRAVARTRPRRAHNGHRRAR